MRKRNKVVSLLLAGCMAAGLLAGCGSSGEAQVATADNATAASTSTGAADSAAPETAGEVDGQINLRAVSFGNNFDVQDMGWRWMMAECYEGLMRDVADENGDRFEYAGAESPFVYIPDGSHVPIGKYSGLRQLRRAKYSYPATDSPFPLSASPVKYKAVSGVLRCRHGGDWHFPFRHCCC